MKPFIETAPLGSGRKVWSFCLREALGLLRSWCTIDRVPLGSIMGWHAFRRGTASDRLCDGDSIHSILLDGGWRSSAVLSYLITDEVDARINGVSAINDSDSELE